MKHTEEDMSGPFGQQTRENVFGQPSATFGQGFGHVFGGQQSSGLASDGKVTEARSSNPIASLFGPSSSDRNLFSQGDDQMNSSTASGQNLFRQFTSSAPDSPSQAFSGGIVFGGAKLFGGSTSSTGESKSVSSIFATSSETSSKTTSSKSLQSVFDKEPKSKGLFGNPSPSSVFGSSSISSSKPRQLFGKDIGEYSDSLEQDIQQSSVANTAASDEYSKDQHDFQGNTQPSVIIY